MTSPSAETTLPPGQGGMLRPFQHGVYRRMWIANLGSNFGSSIQTTGAGWLMTSLTTDTSLVALVQGSSAFAIMIFAVVAGALADNFARRKVMMVANAFMLIVSALLLAMTLLGVLTPWWLLAFTFLVGCGGTLNAPSWQASVGDLVPRHDLPGAVTLNSVNVNLSRCLAPALGGIMIAGLGVATAFAANAVSYIGVLWVLARWPEVEAARTLPRERIGRSIHLGLRFAAMSPDISRVLLRGFAFGLGGACTLALLPAIARVLLGGGPKTYGLMLGAFGVGGLIGAVMNSRVRMMLRNEIIVRMGFLLTAAGLVIIALSRDFRISSVGLLIAGAAWVLTLSLLNVTVQLSTPRWVVGRMMAIYQSAVFGGFMIGSWTWGTIAHHHSIPLALGCAAITLVVGAALGFLRPVPDPMKNDLKLSEHWKEPELALEIRPNSGPIHIELEYLINEEDLPEFMEVIELRRRARLRDGAHHWMLVRDLHEPRRWQVSYQFPTWLEYVRHNLRVMEQDLEHGRRLRNIDQNGANPVVRRWIERQPTLTPPAPREGLEG